MRKTSSVYRVLALGAMTQAEPAVTRANASLLLEQILKCLPGIIGPQTSRRGCLFLPRHANFEQVAVVTDIFLGNSSFHGLHAFKAAAWIKVGALLARVQFVATLGALAITRHATLQDSSALCASGNSTCSRQIDRARSECIVAPRLWRAPRRWPFAGLWPPSALISIFAVAILISMLTVFRHPYLPEPAAVFSTRRRLCGKQVKFKSCAAAILVTISA